ncbi:MAG: SpoVA/SpoVAEb family sporulation membrane protein [Clostridia bacterium]|nr:SpoVA/SpoVAEb family sporulation membrane protein [Clostridia bacterium]
MNEKEKQEYVKYAEGRAEKSPLLRDCIWAFCVGGGICVFAEGLFGLYKKMGIAEEIVKSLVPVTLIALTALLTGIGVFDNIAKRAGAGTLVPITGFANSVVAPAIDNKAEGWILGLGAKIFIIAGPVIAYGTATSVAYGVIYWFMQRL